MENIAVAIITALATVFVALVSVFGGRRISRRNIPDQAKLIATLKDTLIAQTERIKLLEASHEEQTKLLLVKEEEIKDLRVRVEKLEQLTIEQALIISQLQRRRGRQKSDEGGEIHTDEHNRIQ